MTTKTKTKLIGLVVTTAHKGVFFGYGTPTDADTIVLTKARMCVYWSADVRGVLGLAVGGPTDNCKITDAVQEITLRDVTGVIEMTPEAIKAWELKPWA